MNILFTVGTTSFPALEFSALELSKASEFQIELQTPASTAISNQTNFRWFDYYNEDPVQFLQRYDYVVSHAGTGTIFNLLKANTKFCITPNTDRHDRHQQEICEWLVANEYAKLVYDPGLITQFFLSGEYKEFKPNRYKPSYFNVDALLSYLLH